MGCYSSVHLVTDDDGKCIQGFDAGYINEPRMRNCRSYNCGFNLPLRNFAAGK